TQDIPVTDTVRSACAFLGFDPLQIANEGTFVAIVPENAAQDALTALKKCKYTPNPARIGTVQASGRFPLVCETAIGGTRPVPVPSGKLLPRIC
ncbi:MAG: hydrogenase expression/formation protein HypE, partial [Chitinivibrionales bacterium]|nr:hydrogenase expression/formation protein HypE [Chitinivibrionales bacterium]